LLSVTKGFKSYVRLSQLALSLSKESLTRK